MASKKFYAVKVGRLPGIYQSWEECKNQIHGYPGAIYKAFSTKEEAERYFTGDSAKAAVKEQASMGAAGGYHIYVDGSFQKHSNQYSWAFVVYKGCERVFMTSGVGENSEAAILHNVAGELAAAMRAVRWALDNGIKPVVIHHDYMGISAWAKGEWKAKNKFTQAYAAFMSPHMEWVRFNKVEGHAGIEGNELADKLAGEAISQAVDESL